VYRLPSTSGVLFAFAAALDMMLFATSASALEIEPGIGGGVEYTDNARLTSANEKHDLIAISYVGARISEDNGAISADATASFNHQHYTEDSYTDRQYLNLGATVDWEMVKNRFNWLMQDYYTQRPVNSLDAITPDNLQNVNIFTFGANMKVVITGRHTFSLHPEYRSFYYEGQPTDNQQYSLSANWNYQIYRLTSVGLNASRRNVDYDESGIANITFSSVYFAISTKRVRSDLSINLGATRVEKEGGRSTDGFAGNLGWLVNLASNSSVRTYIATDLTDSSNSSLNAAMDPGTGDPNNLQVTGDTIRNKVMTVAYNRQDGALDSGLTAELRELSYSGALNNDRKIRSLNAAFNYPLTVLLSGGFYARYRNTELIDATRMDNVYTVGANLGYSLSRNLRGKFDIRFNNSASTDDTQDYNEFSAFVSLVYGYGNVSHPSRHGRGN
jgi:hypothetical protein